MKANEIINKLINILVTIDIDDIGIILNKCNNLGRYDSINRLIIHSQMKNAFDLRTEQEWFEMGRKIKPRQQPIFVVYTDTKYKYFDGLSGEEFINRDMNNEEFKAALKYGIITKKLYDNKLKIGEVFDISQTYCDDKSEYKTPTPIVSISDMLDFIEESFNIKVEKSDEYYFSKNNKILYICNDSFENIYDKLISVIIDNTDIQSILNKFKIDITNNNIDFIRYAVRFSLRSLIKQEEFNANIEIYEDELIGLISVVDTIVFPVISIFDIEGSYCSDIDSHQIEVNSKAEMIANLYESCKMRNRVKK